MLKFFEFSHVKETIETWLVDGNKFSWIIQLCFWPRQENEVSATIILIILWDILMFYQIFLLPQVKQCVIINHKHATYELPHKLPNDLGS